MDRNIIKQIKKDNLVIISSILELHKLTCMECAEISDGNTLILFENPDDDDRTMTLDRIKIENGKIVLEGSSAYNNTSILAEDVNVETLIDIVEWLEEYRDEIEEYASVADDDAPKKKYVFRFYWRQWADVVVEATDETEAEELALEKYNEGDYLSDDSDFENTGSENVTKFYEENNIPF